MCPNIAHRVAEETPAASPAAALIYPLFFDGAAARSERMNPAQLVLFQALDVTPPENGCPL